MQMEHFLFELAPDLLDGIQPRRIGRQEHQGDLAGLQGGDHIGLEVDRPIIQGDEEAFSLRVTVLHGEQIAQEGLVVKGRALPVDQASGGSIQTACNAPRGVLARALSCTRAIRVAQGIVIADGGTAIIGQFILVEQHQVGGISLHLLPDAAQTRRLEGVVRVRRMHVAPAPLVSQVKAVEQLPDARQGERPEPRHGLPQAVEPPATAWEAKALRGLMHRLVQLGHRQIHLSRRIHRGKKRAYARVLCAPPGL